MLLQQRKIFVLKTDLPMMLFLVANIFGNHRRVRHAYAESGITAKLPSVKITPAKS